MTLFSRFLRCLPALLLTLAGAAHAQGEPLKAGFIYIGPTGDHGWTYAHDQGRKAMEAKFAGKVSTTFVENVPETADAERVIRDLATKGHKIIFATSFGYMNAMEKVSRQFPKTVFMHATGYKTGKNFGIYDVRTYEGAYMLGVVAGKMSKSGKLGVVGSIAIPEVVRNINAFTLGARSVNPNATTRVIWVNNWFDPGKEREAALALISQGADVLMQNTDSPAVVQTAQEKGVYAFGWDSDMSKFGGKAQLAASMLHWETIYGPEIQKVIDGTWKTVDLWYGVKEGAVDIDNFGPDTPADVKKLALERRDAIKAGKLHPFTGPLKDNSGKEMLAAGKVMADVDLRKMNVYVEGVEGSVPK
ncbi:MAG: BMP family ABC transporter substrate-binding protein [Candidatus Dactylopiibacterium carminicum]|uniref:BMP family ABC transporter substrate-binding protein n=1 Tax=Candidatus Dactylopiibacterium carminicum TaxID=857335 RepID=A0A272ET95_9RHOO|nr:BMP family ABC transporter substrate-binding protein [Candidatus Dactylopiibacterium carminicum]KAF7599316.1 BMP family ABC transporter substrate-binding protein [Candidatus Dactylopiibacterium carminicum]PAS93307.1 MAG: BMP family ABC transporter substrate-binding protein [Candidatus Dactylopiibacterium carminicum]